MFHTHRNGTLMERKETFPTTDELKLRKNTEMSWEELPLAFQLTALPLYHSAIKVFRARRQLKALNFDTSAKNAKWEPETIRQLIGEIERLANLAYDEDKSNHYRAQYSGLPSSAMIGPRMRRVNWELKIHYPKRFKNTFIRFKSMNPT